MLIIQSDDSSRMFGWDLEQNQTGVTVSGKGPSVFLLQCSSVFLPDHEKTLVDDI